MVLVFLLQLLIGSSYIEVCYLSFSGSSNIDNVSV